MAYIEVDVDVEDFSAEDLSFADRDTLLEALAINAKRNRFKNGNGSVYEAQSLANMMSYLNDSTLAELVYYLDYEIKARLKEKLEFYSLSEIELKVSK